jgi:hypothetical protein
MNITNTTRLRIKHLMTDMYKGHNVKDTEKIEYAIDRVLGELENQQIKTYAIGNDTMRGCIVPVAELFSTRCEHVELNDKKYLSNSEESICIFAAENYAALIKAHVPYLMPNGWGDAEEVVYSMAVYTTATCRDMDCIYELVYE